MTGLLMSQALKSPLVADQSWKKDQESQEHEEANFQQSETSPSSEEYTAQVAMSLTIYLKGKMSESLEQRLVESKLELSELHSESQVAANEGL